ncbi:MAG: ERAP1-like C-terminal domain-containing protein [Polyangia bacterium]
MLSACSAARDHNVLRVIADQIDGLDLLVKDAGDTSARQTARSPTALCATRLTSQDLHWRARASRKTTRSATSDLHHNAGIDALQVQKCHPRKSSFWRRPEMVNPRAVDPNLAGPFVAIAAKFGDEPRYDRWVETFQTRKAAGKTPQKVARYLHTLSHFRRPELVQRTLQLIEQGMIPQEAVAAILAQLLSFRHSQLSAWEFLKQHWGTLRQQPGDMGVSQSSMHSGGCAKANGPTWCDF